MEISYVNFLAPAGSPVSHSIASLIVSTALSLTKVTCCWKKTSFFWPPVYLFSRRFRFHFEEIKFLWVQWHCFTEASKMTPASGLRSCTLHICNIWQSLFNGGTQGRNFMIRCSFIKRKNCQQGIERGYWEEWAAVKEETLAMDNIFFV